MCHSGRCVSEKNLSGQETFANIKAAQTGATIASSGGCLTRREIKLFSNPSLCQPVVLWAPRWWLSSKNLRPSQGGRQVLHIAAASPEVLVEHDGGFVVLGHALEHSVRGHGRRVSSSTTTPSTSPSWRGSPIPTNPTPTTRRTRRLAALLAPRRPALVGRSRDTRSSQLHAAACPACCTALNSRFS